MDGKYCGTVVVQLCMMMLTWVMPGDEKLQMTKVIDLIFVSNVAV